MQLHAARVRGHAEVVEIGFAIEAHAFLERETSAVSGAIEKTSERRHR